MACPACGEPTVPFAIPPESHELAPAGAEAAAICTRCLTVEPAEESGDGRRAPGGQDVQQSADGRDVRRSADGADVSRVSEAFPTGPAAVPFALCLGLCDSLATNRRAIETALEATERAGADPLLAIDRLLGDPSVEPAIDLERRRHQLEDMLY